MRGMLFKIGLDGRSESLLPQIAGFKQIRNAEFLCLSVN